MRKQTLLGDPTNPSHFDYLIERMDELDAVLRRVEEGEDLDLTLDHTRQVVAEGVAVATQLNRSTLFVRPARVVEMEKLGGFEAFVAAKRQAA